MEELEKDNLNEEQSSIKGLINKIAKDLEHFDIEKWNMEQVEVLRILVKYETSIFK